MEQDSLHNEQIPGLEPEETTVADTSTNDENEENQVSDQDALRSELDTLKDTHLRLMAEYDNYRKRTLKEKSDLLRNGGERVLRDLLPVVDDFDLALSHLEASDDIEAMREGFKLIHKKLMDYLLSVGVKPIETGGLPFDDAVSEAIALVPAPTPEQQGMVIDCTTRGYMINDKVLRFAKVVVGQ